MSITKQGLTKSRFYNNLYMGICPLLRRRYLMPKGRPRRCRRVGFVPQVTYFKPAGIPLRVLQEISLSIEEAEALRLKDMEKLEQEQCAAKMNVSRQTFQRVLGSAREKIADALLNGKAIRIEGGDYEIAINRFRCLEGHEWDVPSEALSEELARVCPICNTTDISSGQPAGRGRGRGMKGTGGRRRVRYEKEQ